MLRGLECEDVSERHGNPTIIYEDDAVIAVSKPSGMPSVPGLDGKQSALEWLKGDLHVVHRLDMDTSGVILFAKTEEAAVNLRKQFEQHSIRKTYIARLCPASMSSYDHSLNEGCSGRISFPLGPDYDERPRQKADFKQGKEAITDYKVLSERNDGTTDIEFSPITGRTHQLRVHSAHHLGLCRPIVGDLLYGGYYGSARLHLHAQKIEFVHPLSGQTIIIESSENRF
jgi:tRNA pseudouridine32 synthase/23S rRNA pseudouridine746 synthase